MSACRLGVGGYNTVMPLKVSGTQANPIVIENYENETVIIDGTDADMSTTTWVPCGANSWQTTAFNVGGASTAQIWVNPTAAGEPGSRLRFRGIRGCSGLQPGEFVISDTGTTISLRLPDSSDPKDADIRLSCQNGDCASYPIHASADAKWITVKRNPAGGAVYVKYGYYNLFVENGARNLTFDGIQFVAAGGRDYGSCVRVFSGSSITVMNGLCREAMSEGIAFYGGGPGGANGEGIQLFDNLLENMDVYDTGRAWVDGGGAGNNLGMSVIVKNCSHCVVRGNRVHDSYGSAISVTTSTTSGMRSDDVVVDANSVWNYGYLNTDLGTRTVSGIQIEPQTPNGITGGITQNNQIFNGMAMHAQWEDGIRLSSAGAGIVIVNNSLNEIGGPCINLSEQREPVTLRNNAMSRCSTKGPTCNGVEHCALYAGSAAHTRTNNTFWSTNSVDVVVLAGTAPDWGAFTVSNVTDYEPTAVEADPQFTSSTNLRLRSGSALIDAGTDTDCPVEDADGLPRPVGKHCDVGAFEFPGDRRR